MAEKALWRCPVCGRRFAKRKQAHSCRPVSLDSHFEGKATPLKDLFEHLCKQLRRFGPLRIDAVKTSINLIPKHHMGGVRVLRDRLHVGFVLGRRVQNPRILLKLQVSQSAYLYAVDIAKRDDLDPALLSLLKEAYRRAARA